MPNAFWFLRNEQWTQGDIEPIEADWESIEKMRQKLEAEGYSFRPAFSLGVYSGIRVEAYAARDLNKEHPFVVMIKMGEVTPYRIYPTDLPSLLELLSNLSSLMNAYLQSNLRGG